MILQFKTKGCFKMDKNKKEKDTKSQTSAKKPMRQSADKNKDNKKKQLNKKSFGKFIETLFYVSTVAIIS